MVTVTTIATLHTWTANFWADLQQRIIDRAENERQNDCSLCQGWKTAHWTLIV